MDQETPKLLDYQILLFFLVCNSAIIKQDTKIHEFLLKKLQQFHTVKVPMDFVNENRKDKDGKFPYQKQS